MSAPKHTGTDGYRKRRPSRPSGMRKLIATLVGSVGLALTLIGTGVFATTADAAQPASCGGTIVVHCASNGTVTWTLSESYSGSSVFLQYGEQADPNGVPITESSFNLNKGVPRTTRDGYCHYVYEADSPDTGEVVDHGSFDDQSQCNAAPQANNDTAATTEDTAVSIDVLANDTDANNDTLSVTDLAQPGHGSTAVVGSQVKYTPTTGYTGTDTFTYKASDGKASSDAATVTVTVTAKLPPPPTCVDASKAVLSHTWNGQGGTITLAGTLPLCSSLYIKGASYTFDQGATGNPPYPQTKAGETSVVVVSKPGSYSFTTPKVCGQVDAYAKLGSAPVVPATLTAPGSNNEPQFVSDFSTGAATYRVDSAADCSPTPTPIPTPSTTAPSTPVSSTSSIPGSSTPASPPVSSGSTTPSAPHTSSGSSSSSYLPPPTAVTSSAAPSYPQTSWNGHTNPPRLNGATGPVASASVGQGSKGDSTATVEFIVGIGLLLMGSIMLLFRRREASGS